MIQPALKNAVVRAIETIMAAAVIVGFSGCATESQPALTPGRTVILAFGDSLTYGRGVRTRDSYPAILEKITGFTVINAGVRGETTEDGLKRLPRLLELCKPAAVVLCEGGNDMLQMKLEADTKANLDKMIELIHASGASVVLVGVPYLRLPFETADYYLDLARKHNIQCQATVLKRLLSVKSLKSDEIHLNKQGYAMLAQAVSELLEKAMEKK